MTELASYRRKIMAIYAIGGVVLGIAMAVGLQDTGLAAVLCYISAIILPTFIGAAIAIDVRTLSDRWDPVARWDGIVDAAPLGLVGAAGVLLVVAALYATGLIKLIPFPPTIYAIVLARWVQKNP
jgi:hypothetical protein